jgi:nitrite reductase/ring-hydroxylating ferredoxin subunit
MTGPVMSRRGFLKRAWQGVTALVATSMGYVGWRFLESRPQDERTVKVVVAGSIESFLPGSVTPFPSGQFYLVRSQDGGFLALSQQCTHLACTVLWQNETFRCPCHGSEFEHTGHVINSPASEALWRYQVNIEDNRIVVDTSRKLERSANPADDFVYRSDDPT